MSRMLCKGLVVLIAFSLLTTGEGLAKNVECMHFSLQGVTPGYSRAKVQELLGEEDSVTVGVFDFVSLQVRVTLSGDRERVISVTGEAPLEFAGVPIARVGQSPEEIHRILGEPDQAIVEEPSKYTSGIRIDNYDRFYLRVLYRLDHDSGIYRVVTFNLTSQERIDFHQKDPSER